MKEIIQLIHELASASKQIGTAAWPMLVHFQRVSGLTDVGYALTVLALPYMWWRKVWPALHERAKVQIKAYNVRNGHDENYRTDWPEWFGITTTVTAIVSAILVLITTYYLWCGMTGIFAPEGCALRSLINQIHPK